MDTVSNPVTPMFNFGLSGQDVLAKTWAFKVLYDWSEVLLSARRYMFMAPPRRHCGDGSGGLRKFQKVNTTKGRIMHSAWFFCYVKEEYCVCCILMSTCYNSSIDVMLLNLFTE